MIKYNLDIEKLTKWLLPPLFRRPKFLAMIKVVVKPLKTLYNNFLHEGDVMLAEAQMTAQTGNLEWILNTRFDPRRRRIKITHLHDYASFWNDEVPITLGNSEAIVLQNNMDDGVDFHVRLPFDFTQNYQIDLRGRFASTKPLVLASTPLTLSNTVSSILYDTQAFSTPLVLTSVAPVIFHSTDNVGTINLMKAVVGRYKLAGKTFTINT